MNADDDRQLKVGERAAYLRSLASAAQRVAELARDPKFATMPTTHDYLLARYVHGMILAMIGLSKADVRAAFLDWLQTQIRDDWGLCSVCGGQKTRPQDVGCPTCLAAIAAFEAELLDEENRT